MIRISHFSTVIVIVATVGLVNSQQPSEQCRNEFNEISKSPDAACLNAAAIPAFMNVELGDRFVPALNNWLTGFCARDPCTDQQLAAVATNITKGCSPNDDPWLFRFNSSDNSVITRRMQAAYPTFRKMVCLKEASNNTLCLTTRLKILPPSSIGLLLPLYDSLFSTGQLYLAGPIGKDVACGDCTKAAFNIYNASFPSNVTGWRTGCGAAFVDGATPTGVVEGTGTAAPKSDASSLFNKSPLIGIAAAALSAISAAFVILS